MEDKTIYGDGARDVRVTEDEVIVREHYEDVDGTTSYRMIAFSHAAFREVVIGWERWHEQQEDF